MYAYALGLTARKEDAEDAVQQVFLGVSRALEGGREIREPRAYLYQAVRREVRRRPRGPEAVPVGDLEIIVAPDQDRAARALDISRALAALPDEQREVAILKLYHHHTFAEIGDLMEISPNTAASRYRYALEKLRVALATDGEEAR